MAISLQPPNVLSSLLDSIDSFAFDMRNVVRAACGLDTLTRNAPPVQARAMSTDDIWVAAWYKFCLNMDDEMEMESTMDSILNVYMEGSETFAVAVGQGKLYKIPVTVNGSDIVFQSPQEVVQQFVPVSRSRTMIFRQADGRVRFAALSSTSTLNRDGKIDGTALFDSMETHDYSEIGMPYLTFWHNGVALRMGQVDMLWREGNCYFNSGLFDKDFPFTEEVAHTLETDGDYWGISIGFMATSEPILVDIGGIPIPVFQAGYQVELSILPEKRAASNLTRINVQRGKTMNATQRADARRLIGDDAKADEFIKGMEHAAKTTEQVIQEKKMITRETAADATKTDAAAATTTDEVEQVIELTDELVDQIANTILQSKQFTDLDLRLQDLEAAATEQRSAGNAEVLTAIAELRTSVESRLSALEQTDTEKIRGLANDSPARSKVRLAYRATELRAEQQLKQALSGGTLLAGGSQLAAGVRQDVV